MRWTPPRGSDLWFLSNWAWEVFLPVLVCESLVTFSSGHCLFSWDQKLCYLFWALSIFQIVTFIRWMAEAPPKTVDPSLADSFVISFFLKINFILCVWLPHVFLCAVCMKGPWEPEQGGCELPCVCWELNPGPVHVIPALSLQPLPLCVLGFASWATGLLCRESTPVTVPLTVPPAIAGIQVLQWDLWLFGVGFVQAMRWEPSVGIQMEQSWKYHSTWFKDTETKPPWCWHKHRVTWNRIDPEVNPCYLRQQTLRHQNTCRIKNSLL